MKIYNCYNDAVADIQGKLFVLAYKKGYDVFDFVKQYMKGDLSNYIDGDFSIWQMQCEQRLLSHFVIDKYIKKNSEKIDVDALYWMGYFYRYWNFITRENSKDIVDIFTPKQALESYYYYHLFDFDRSIEEIKDKYNLRRNAHRKYEYEHSGKEYIPYNDKTYLKHLGRYILFNFYKDKRINLTKKVFDEDYDFVGDEIGIKTISTKNKELYKTLKKYDVKKDIKLKSCLFVFLKNDLYKKNYFSIINQIKKFARSHRTYNYVYICTLGNLFVINSQNEINRFSISIKSEPIKKILKEIKKASI